MRFENYFFLLLLVLIPMLHAVWKKRNRPARVKYSIPIPVQERKASPFRVLLPLRYIGWGLLVVALARPQTSFRQTERSVEGIDIMVVMDVSASMNIEDLDERSRFDVAKETISNFIQARTNDRIGLVIFSGEPFTSVPVTLDHTLVLQAVRDVRSGILKDGTAIGDGLSLAIARLKDSKAKTRIIVLLTDGDNNVGQVHPETAGELASGYGIRTYTIAIGKEGRVRMPIRTTGVFGNTMTTYQWFDNALNPEILKKIAEITKAKFFRVTDAGTLASVFKEIDQLERSKVKTMEKVRYDEKYQRLLKISLALLIIEQLFLRGWWGVIP